MYHKVLPFSRILYGINGDNYLANLVYLALTKVSSVVAAVIIGGGRLVVFVVLALAG